MDQDRLNRSHQITFKQTFTLYTLNETFSRADYHRVKTHTRNDQQSRCLCPIYAAEQSYAHTTTEVHPFALNPTSQREYLKKCVRRVGEIGRDANVAFAIDWFRRTSMCGAHLVDKVI